MMAGCHAVKLHLTLAPKDWGRLAGGGIRREATVPRGCRAGSHSTVVINLDPAGTWGAWGVRVPGSCKARSFPPLHRTQSIREPGTDPDGLDVS